MKVKRSNIFLGKLKRSDVFVLLTNITVVRSLVRPTNFYVVEKSSSIIELFRVLILASLSLLRHRFTFCFSIFFYNSTYEKTKTVTTIFDRENTQRCASVYIIKANLLLKIPAFFISYSTNEQRFGDLETFPYIAVVVI